MDPRREKKRERRRVYCLDREIRGATVKVGCVRVDASSVDLPVS